MDAIATVATMDLDTARTEDTEDTVADTEDTVVDSKVTVADSEDTVVDMAGMADMGLFTVSEASSANTDIKHSRASPVLINTSIMHVRVKFNHPKINLISYNTFARKYFLRFSPKQLC